MLEDNFSLSLEQLFNKYYNDAFYYTYSLSQDKEISKDVVMDAFYKVLTNKDTDYSNFKSWLLKVCKNLYIDYYRKSKRNCSCIDFIQNEEELINEMIKEEKYRNLYRAIHLLSSLEQECINLYYFENLRINDIANIVNKSSDNVKVILMRSRKKLKKLMEE